MYQDTNNFFAIGGYLTLSGGGTFTVFATDANEATTCSGIQSVGNGWYELTFAGNFTANTPGTSVNFFFDSASNDFTPTVGQTFYFWGEGT